MTISGQETDFPCNRLPGSKRCFCKISNGKCPSSDGMCCSGMKDEGTVVYLSTLVPGKNILRNQKASGDEGISAVRGKSNPHGTFVPEGGVYLHVYA